MEPHVSASFGDVLPDSPGEKTKAETELPWWAWVKVLDDDKKPEPAKVFPCEDAEPQSLRNVSRDFVGLGDEFPNLIHLNTHFHLGAEHVNVEAGGYSLAVEEAMRKPENIIPDDIRPGYFCDRVEAEPAPPATLDPYEFKHCKNVKVGYTYEFHWVYSRAGPKMAS
ncbi:unnamed protein product [Durusdinium trenchii]|uniref:Uncharacterized protein n=2 Tax=Durusdinium trenchii TaxID=1381693 RepID=A0ABP0IA55_9DINO